MIVIQKSPDEQVPNKAIEQLKRLQKKLQDIQNKDVKPKKTIIVIGRIGDGKSSFIKMLVSQEDKAKIKSGLGTKLITDQCSFYEICPQIKKSLQIPEQQKIYLMDTPGLISKAKNLIMDQIRKKLILQKCQVIYILYIKNSTQFRQQQENDSIAMYYALPIPKKIKDKITSFVFTNYDRQAMYRKQFETFMSSFHQRYKKNNLDFLLSKTIKWISFTQQQQNNQILRENLQQQPRLKKAFQQQWQDLKQILKNKSENKFTYNQLLSM